MRIRDWLAEKTGAVRAIGTAIACLIGAQIVIPGINTGLLADFFRSGGASPLLRLYDWFVGGALARGAILGLGVMPYITARIYLRLLRIVSPSAGDASRRQKLTRWLTLGFSLVQSYGFARFAQRRGRNSLSSLIGGSRSSDLRGNQLRPAFSGDNRL